MNRTVCVVTHNTQSGGAATACRRLIDTFKYMSLDVELHQIKNVEKIRYKTIQGTKLQLRSGLLSRLDYLICRFLEQGARNWQSIGILGQLKAKKIEENEPLFINIHWIGHATISLRQISKLKFPVLITAHDEWWLNAVSHYTEEQKNQSQTKVRKLIFRWCLKKKKAILEKKNFGIVCLSEEMKSKFLEKYPFLRDRIVLIPNPVDDKVFFPRPKSDSSHSFPTVAYLGGFSDRRKGYDLLLDALMQCSEKFNLIAPGFKGKVKSGKYDQIEIVGIPRIESEQEMNQFLNNALVTVVPSRMEALAQSATESLMAGTPVVSFYVGGLIDVVIDGTTGIKVRNYDTEALAKALDSCIKDEIKFDLDTHSFAIKNFSKSKAGNSYIAFSKKFKTR